MPYFKRVFPFHKYAFYIKVEIALHVHPARKTLTQPLTKISKI